MVPEQKEKSTIYCLSLGYEFVYEKVVQAFFAVVSQVLRMLRPLRGALLLDT